MAVIQGRTRAQLRQSIGYNLGAVYVSSASGSGTTSTIVDNTLTGADDNHNGKWVVFNDADGTSGQVTRVSDYTSSSTTLTVSPSLAANPATSDTYELWDAEFSPTVLDDFINQSIIEVTGNAWDPIEYPATRDSSGTVSPQTALHTDGRGLRFRVPSGISMIQDIYYRNSVDFTRLHACAEAFDEHSTLVATTLDGAITSTSATSVAVASATPLRANQQILVGSEKMTISSISSNTLTVSRGAGGSTAGTHSDGASVLLFPVVDTEGKKQGTGSNKFIIPTAASAGNIVTDSITSKDISGYDYIEFWAKSTVAASEGNLKILLDNTASCASPLETLEVPALSADTWAFCRVALANPETDTAIISVGLEYDADIGAATVWLDDISVVKNDTADWIKVPRNLWRIDKEAKDVVFKDYMSGFAPYKLLKIVGGDKPALLSSDSDTSEVSERYLIAAATARAFASNSGGPGTDPDQRRGQAGFWFGMASSAKKALPFLANVRLVE